MDKIARLRQEIERLMELNNASMESTKKISRINAAGYYEALVDVENFLDTLSEEPVQKFNTDKLQEIAKPATPHKKPTPEDREKFMEELHEYAESKKPDKSLEEEVKNYFQGYWPGTDTAEQCNTDMHFTPPAIIRLASHFVEWQKEQDQPITGNSLEQEWLRYVDKRKKEYGGELPSLGEYGWLQIARHFAEWQASRMPMPEDTVLFNKGVAEGRRLEREDMLGDAISCEVDWYDGPILNYSIEQSCEVLAKMGIDVGDKVRIVVLKEGE